MPHDGDMVSSTPGQSRSEPQLGARVALVLDEAGPLLNGSRAGRVDRVVTRLRAFTLDRRLSEGQPPEHDRHLAIRAQVLVALPTRQKLARDWEHTVDLARGIVRPQRSGIPLCRDQVAIAVPAIEAMVALLRLARPVPVRGVARASHLLVDGSGPLYDRRSAWSLGSAIDDAIRHLDPSTELFA